MVGVHWLAIISGLLGQDAYEHSAQETEIYSLMAVRPKCSHLQEHQMKWAFGVVLVAECVTDVVEKKKIKHLLHKKSQAVIIYSTIGVY